MQQLRTEYPFTLPKGYLDADGTLHREGTMRLATARDELEPLNDPKVSDPDDPYLAVIVLSRVVTRLGTHTRLSPRDIEGLFAADLAYLQDVYSIINYGTPAEVQRWLAGPQDRAAPLTPQDVPVAAASSTAGPAFPAPTGTPISDAARSLVGGQAAPGPSPETDDEEPAFDRTPRAPRRGRIEEVGRSSGRPGGV